MYCLTCGSQLQEGTAICPVCGATQQANTPMKWFKFLIWFSLFASAVLNAISGFQFLTGMCYGGEKEAKLFYAIFSDMKTVDTLYGIALIAVAVLAIYTRFRLAGYYQNGPKMLMLIYAVNAVIMVAYWIGVSSALGDFKEYLNTSSYIPNIAVSVAMIFVNKTYFDKRAHLFTK